MKDYSGEAVEIPEQMKKELQAQKIAYADAILKAFPPSAKDNFNVFLGHAGRAYIFLKLWKQETDEALKAKYLSLAQNYVDVSLQTIKPGYSSFFQGPVGPYALGAIIYDLLGDAKRRDQLIGQVLTEFSKSGAYDICTLDEGKAGLIWAGIFLNNVFGKEIVPRSEIVKVANEAIDQGLAHGFSNGTMQWPTPIFDFTVIGQGHGSGGVIRMLLEVPEVVFGPRGQAIKNTLDYFVSLQLPSGNFPSPAHPPYNTECPAVQGVDCLVQFCHGAPGFVGLLAKAYSVYLTAAPADAKRYLNAADRAADSMWARGLLTKGLMFCHGIGGNAYLFLGHARYTGSVRSQWRALQFVSYALDPKHTSPDVMRVGDTPSALFQGTNAVATLYADLLRPNWLNITWMPGYDPDGL